MKNIAIKAFSLLCITSLMLSCSDISFGNGMLDQLPESTGVDEDMIFDSEYYADQVLTQAYTTLTYGIPYNTGTDGYDMISEAISDLGYCTVSYAASRSVYYLATYSSSVTKKNKVIYPYVDGEAWSGIRSAWIYVENVDRVPDMSDELKAQRKAEAKAIIAYQYAELFRNYGGLPWLDHAIESSEEMNFPRQTLEKTVNNIVSLLDEAIADLPWTVSTDDNGRITKAFAMGLKLRVLLMAASPLFNASEPYREGEAATGLYVWYGDYQQSRWERAATAGAEFIAQLEKSGGYSLTKSTAANPTETQYRDAYTEGYFTRTSPEMLLSTRTGYTNSWSSWPAVSNRPSLNYFYMFDNSDGTSFLPDDFDSEDLQAENTFWDAYEGGAADPYANRDPRMKATILTNGTYYKSRYAELYVGGLECSTETTDGTGFMLYKFAQDYVTTMGAVDSWPAMRLPEVYLAYAEALNESNGGPTQEACELLYEVRSRVGMTYPSVTNMMACTQSDFREMLLKERACEFGYEQVRWYDITRWKRDDLMKEQIKRLLIYPDGDNFTYSVTGVSNNRDWATNFDSKWYLSAFPIDDIDMDYGLVQNPGW